MGDRQPDAIWGTTLVFDDGCRLICSRNDLRHMSLYFDTMWASGFPEAQQNEAVLHDVEAWVFESMIGFWYGCPIDLHDEKLKAIAQAADRFQFLNVISFCRTYMAETLTSTVAVKYLSVAEEVPSLHCQRGLCRTFIAENLEICLFRSEGTELNPISEKIRALSLTSINDFLNCQFLHVSTEVNKFSLIADWLQSQDPQVQANAFITVQLLATISFGEMSRAELRRVVEHPLINENPLHLRRITAVLLDMPPLETGLRELEMELAASKKRICNLRNELANPVSLVKGLSLMRDKRLLLQEVDKKGDRMDLLISKMNNIASRFRLLSWSPSVPSMVEFGCPPMLGGRPGGGIP
eukprot:jgi/Botrbrau1/4750/Bobra.0137s0022.1